MLKHRDHAIWIEAAIRKVNVRVDANLQLSAFLRGSRVDSYLSQSSQMVRTLMRINHMNRLLVTMEPISDEREQDPILFFIVVEESADMARFIELGTSEGNGSRDLLHSISPWISSGAPFE